jgi:hypothetical protein
VRGHWPPDSQRALLFALGISAALCPSSQNEIGSLSTRHSLSVIATLSQSVIGLMSLGSFGAHKNVVAANVEDFVSVSCRVIA